MSSTSQILFILCGPSGVGKTTLAHHLLQMHDDLVFSTSVTTRAARHNEADGVDYHFVDPARFAQMRDAGAFAEWAEVHGNYYGTTVETIEQAWAQRRNVIFDIDYQGALQLRERFGTRAVVVLVLPPSMALLEERLRGRGTDDDGVINGRMDAARHEIEELTKFADHVMVNAERAAAVEEITRVYAASL